MNKLLIAMCLSVSVSSTQALGVFRGVPPSNDAEVNLIIGYSAGVLNRFSGLSCPKTFIIPLINDVATTAYNPSEKIKKQLPIFPTFQSEYSQRLGAATLNKICSVGESEYILSVDGLLNLMNGHQQNVIFAKGFIMSAHDKRVIDQCGENSEPTASEDFFNEVSKALRIAKNHNNGGVPAIQVLDTLFSTMSIPYKCI